MLQIGEVAKQTGIGVETVRYYEREGLIPTPERTASGYRRYTKTVINQLRFILHAKTLGFSLKEISELIELKNTSNAKCKSIRSATQKKVADIQKKIDALEKMKASLVPLIDQCKSNNPVGECPILLAMTEESLTD